MMDYGQLYHENYYETSCGMISYLEPEHWVNFFGMIADKIIESIHPATVLDVGCAVGYLVAALRDRGVDAYGIDVSDFAISHAREDIKPYCRVCSALELLPSDLPQKYDLVVTIEVAEHLYEEDGAKFFENICKYSDQIIFSSTPDDTTEKTHFNVQQAEYWAKRFAVNGYFKELTYNASYIAPQAVKFMKSIYKAERLVEDYERNLRILKNQMFTDVHQRNEQIIHMNALLSEKEDQISNLGKASTSKDELIAQLRGQIEQMDRKMQIEQEAHTEQIKQMEYASQIEIGAYTEQIKQIENDLIFIEQENRKYQDIIVKHEARIQDFIQASQWLHGEVAKWQNSYNRISSSACWKSTKPIRILLDGVKWIVHHFIHNIFTRSLKKLHISVRDNGLRNTFFKIRRKLKDDQIPITKLLTAAISERMADTGTVDNFLNQRLRNTQPVSTIIVRDGVKRLNFVTDSIEAHSLLGGVATALVIATQFANRSYLPLRIITRTTPVNPLHYENIMSIMGIPLPKDVTYYTDYDRDTEGNTIFKLEISDQDIFFATSWWSAAAIGKTTLRKRFYYIIQEVETYFYPHGDEHFLCSQVMRNENIDFIVNSHYLFDYFSQNEPNIIKRGIYFEPAFPKSLYQPRPFLEKKKYKLFFYSRPNNPRNMFAYGMNILNKCIEYGILNTEEWDIYYAGQSIPDLKFNNGYVGINLGLMSWEKYGQFLSTVDLSLSLMYTPHPSYPPFDVVCSGGVVVSNKYGNKETFDWCANVIMSDLDENTFLNAMTQGFTLAKNMPQRQKNFEQSTIPRTWQATIQETLSFMEDKL